MPKRIAAAAAAVVESFEPRLVLSTTLPIMGYLVDYKIGDPSNTTFSESYGATTTTIAHDTLDWAHLTQVNYFALLPNATPTFSAPPTATTLNNVRSDGTLQALTDSGYDPSRQLPALVNEARMKNPYAKVFVTVGAGDPAAIYDMDGLVNTPSAWPTFAKSVHDFVTQYGLDGVDLDWEPTAQAGFTVTAGQIINFGLLVQTIKTAYPSMTLTADALGDPQELRTVAGADSGASAYELTATAVQNLDKINVESYPVSSKAESDAIMQQWATYVTVGSDVSGVRVKGAARNLLYGLDIAGDDTSNNPAGVVEGRTDVAVDNGYGGLFIFELDSDPGTGSSRVVSRIAAEVAARTAGNTDVISGTNAADAITLTRDADATHIDWTSGGQSGRMLAVDPNGLTINGGGGIGNDTIALSTTGGSALPALLKLNGTFTISGLTTLTNSTIDLGRSTLFVNYAGGTDPMNTLRGALSEGRNGGTWLGVSNTGAINSDAAATDPAHATAIGYADAADGRNVDTVPNTIEFRFTENGDANLDGGVDFSDLLIVARNYGVAGAPAWDQGNFDGSDAVDFADLLTLARNYGNQAPVGRATNSFPAFA